MDNKILSFDVSNNNCSVAISLNETIIAYEEELRPSMQAECIMGLIENVLKVSNFEYKDINYLSVTNGPGSFTGIRIGLAVAKGILLACNNIKGIAITNFEIMHFRAMQQVKHYDKIIILLNAYRNQLYFQEFDNKGSEFPSKLINKEDVREILLQMDGNIICCGNGLPVIFEEIKNINHHPSLIILPRFGRIRASNICQLASNKIKQKIFTPIEPLYIRAPDAKIPNL